MSQARTKMPWQIVTIPGLDMLALRSLCKKRDAAVCNFAIASFVWVFATETCSLFLKWKFAV